MLCPDAGFWRAWLDREAEPASQEAESHLAVCSACRSLLSELRANSRTAEEQLLLLAPSAPLSAADLTLARRRLARSVERQRRPLTRFVRPLEISGMSLTFAIPRWRTALAGLAAALALTFVFGTPEGRTAAAAFLAQFRSQSLGVVSFDADQPRRPLAELEHLGNLKVTPSGRLDQVPVKSLAEATQQVGFNVKQPEKSALPDGLPDQPTIAIMPAREVRFTFDRDKASRYFSANAKPAVSLPDRYDGVTLVLSVPPAALLEYRRGTERGLMIGQTREITGGVEGNVSLEEMRDFLLGLPGLSPDTVRQLRDIKDWRNTLPIPVPADKLSWEHTTIAGGDALLLKENTGLGSAVIWLRDGRIYGVAGTLRPEEVERVANSIAR
jgi:hypothetical protein